jgi:hypothetical protein
MVNTGGGEVAPILAEVSVIVDADPEVAEDSLLGLLDELAELDAASVARALDRSVLPGAKGMDAGTGALIVTLSDSAVLVALTGVLRSWVGRDRGRKVRIQLGDDLLEVTRASGEEQARLVEAFLGRHGGG